MSNAITSIQGIKIAGTCPHGLPPGACPICSGMGGGGGGMRKADFSAKPGEMSWNECAAIGNFLRAQKNAQIQAQLDIQNNLIAMAKFQNAMANCAKNVANFAATFANMPAIISKPINMVANKLLVPTLNAIKNMPVNVAKFANSVSQKAHDISDKLAAVFGELKNSLEKKISDSFQNTKKKIISLFAIFKPKDVDDEEKKIEADKRAFEIRTFINDLYAKISNLYNTKDEQDDD